MKEFDLTRLVRSNVANLKPYSSARDEYKTQGQDMIFLDANENPNENGLNRYPDPQQSEVKKKLAEFRDVPAKNILLGNGSDEVLDLIVRAFCEPGSSSGGAEALRCRAGKIYRSRIPPWHRSLWPLLRPAARFGKTLG